MHSFFKSLQSSVLKIRKSLKRKFKLKIPKPIKVFSTPKRVQISISVFVCMILTLLLIVGFILFMPWQIHQVNGPLEVMITKGMTPRHMAVQLHESEIIRSESQFLFAAKLLGLTRTLQAGRFQFQGWVSNWSVLKKLSQGDVVTQLVTIPEGCTAKEIANILQNELGIDPEVYIALVEDMEFAHSLGIQADRLEGYLYPDTYRFHDNQQTDEIIRAMVNQFQKNFCDSLRLRAHEVGFTIHEIVTLASIIEGEAAIPEERSVIAALYLNRMKKRMRLQADPTIQYIISDGPRRLLTRDLQIDSPYNTYRHLGLPPGPVNNPGIACIRAALYPADVNYLYMVANGDGSHTFSKSLRDHLDAKAKFDRVRRQVWREQRARMYSGK